MDDGEPPRKRKKKKAGELVNFYRFQKLEAHKERTFVLSRWGDAQA
jgi:hypothetical protein